MNTNKKYLTNDELAELAVGSVYHKEDEDGVLHFYRCLQEQMDAYGRLSATLGEWSGRTNGVRLDFVTDSSLFSFKVIVGKKYELFVNGVKEDHIELGAGEVFFKPLDTSNGENRFLNEVRKTIKDTVQFKFCAMFIEMREKSMMQ